MPPWGRNEKKITPLTNIDIIDACGNIPDWRGVFMRNALPSTSKIRECGVLNLDDADQPGTHWTCWKSTPTRVHYFDSYGLPPPREFVDYVRQRDASKPLDYSTFLIQTKSDGPICGQLCAYIEEAFSGA